MSRRADVLVLCYHGVSDAWPEAVAVGPQRLHEQVGRLVEHGWRAATFSDAVLAPPASRTLAVTFDDALRSVVRLALPVLEELGAPATVFAPSAFVDSGRPFAWPHIDRWLGTEHAHELEGMSWDELGRLRDAGWEVGSHSATHPRLTSLGHAELAAELRDSKQAIEERLGVACRAIAYPYADVDDRVAAAARAAGYQAGAAMLPGFTDADPLRYPRVPMLSAESPLMHRLHTTRTMRRLQGTRLWTAARGAAERART